jgi:type VI secretion system protein ImpA
VPAISVDALLEPVSEDEPTGADLEYDPAFLALFREAEGTPAREMGGTEIPGEEPDWRSVRDQAVALFGRTKDLRISVLLARALLRLEGLSGLDLGLQVVHGLLDRYWDGLHPALDPDDDNDPTLRVNALQDLTSRELVLHPLRTTPLIRSRTFGPVAYREIEIAEGRASPPPDTEPPDPAAIRGAFQDCAVEDLASTATAAAGALQGIRSLNEQLGAHVSPGQMPSLDPLSELLSGIARTLRAQLAERQPGSPGLADLPSQTETQAASAGLSSSFQAAPGEIASRDDVVRAIDRICDYYSRREPSSPVPLLLLRARRLATASFMEIVRDLAPGAMDEVEKVCGQQPDS